MSKEWEGKYRRVQTKPGEGDGFDDQFLDLYREYILDKEGKKPTKKAARKFYETLSRLDENYRFFGVARNGEVEVDSKGKLIIIDDPVFDVVTGEKVENFVAVARKILPKDRF